MFCKVPDPYPRPFWMIKLPKKMRMSEIFNGTGMEVSKNKTSLSYISLTQGSVLSLLIQQNC